jgi:hypothetical protein
MLIAKQRSRARLSSVRRLSALFVVCPFLLGGGAALAATQVLSPSDDTFINDGNPSNDNGATLSFFTGTDGIGGNMRGLIRFDMPAALAGKVTVTDVALTLTVQALGDKTAGTPATESLQAVTQAWVQGNGFGNAPSAFTVGQLCGGAISGATWNQPNCLFATPWTTPGGDVVATVSGQASTSGVPVGGQVTWSSTTNVAMNADVQAWIDAPAGNHGWRITSSTENAGRAAAQRFISSEAGASAPTLSVTYSCKAGFVPSGNDCVAAAPAPAVGPVPMAVLAVLLGGVAIARSKRVV